MDLQQLNNLGVKMTKEEAYSEIIRIIMEYRASNNTNVSEVATKILNIKIKC